MSSYPCTAQYVLPAGRFLPLLKRVCTACTAGVSQSAQHYVDHEAVVQVAGQGHLSHQQTVAGGGAGLQGLRVSSGRRRALQTAAQRAGPRRFLPQEVVAEESRAWEVFERLGPVGSFSQSQNTSLLTSSTPTHHVLRLQTSCSLAQCSVQSVCFRPSRPRSSSPGLVQPCAAVQSVCFRPSRRRVSCQQARALSALFAVKMRHELHRSVMERTTDHGQQEAMFQSPFRWPALRTSADACLASHALCFAPCFCLMLMRERKSRGHSTGC